MSSRHCAINATDNVLIAATETSSSVWRFRHDPGVVHKHQPKYFTDNEYAFLKAMDQAAIHSMKVYGSAYVPWVERNENDVECLRMQYIERHNITDADEFMAHLPLVLALLTKAGIRHGDLTEYAIIPHNNRPIIIDFAEARWISDPIPSKRPEPDAVLLERAMRKLCTR